MRFQYNVKTIRRQLLHLFLKQQFKKNGLVLIYPKLFIENIFQRLQSTSSLNFLAVSSFAVSYSFFLFMLKTNSLLSLTHGNLKSILININLLPNVFTLFERSFIFSTVGFIKFYTIFTTIATFKKYFLQARRWTLFFEQIYIYSISLLFFVSRAKN